MNSLLISYDLGVPETSQDYKRLIDYIKSFQLWANPLYSVWLVKTDKTVSVVRDEIKHLSDANDRLLVMNVTNVAWASQNLPKDVTDWMHSHL